MRLVPLSRIAPIRVEVPPDDGHGDLRAGRGQCVECREDIRPGRERVVEQENIAAPQTLAAKVVTLLVNKVMLTRRTGVVEVLSQSVRRPRNLAQERDQRMGALTPTRGRHRNDVVEALRSDSAGKATLVAAHEVSDEPCQLSGGMFTSLGTVLVDVGRRS